MIGYLLCTYQFTLKEDGEPEILTFDFGKHIHAPFNLIIYPHLEDAQTARDDLAYNVPHHWRVICVEFDEHQARTGSALSSSIDFPEHLHTSAVYVTRDIQVTDLLYEELKYSPEEPLFYEDSLVHNGQQWSIVHCYSTLQRCAQVHLAALQELGEYCHYAAYANPARRSIWYGPVGDLRLLPSTLKEFSWITRLLPDLKITGRSYSPDVHLSEQWTKIPLHLGEEFANQIEQQLLAALSE